MTAGDSDVVHDLAPTGALRVGIHVGDSLLAQRGADGLPHGAPVALAKALAKELDAPLLLRVYDSYWKLMVGDQAGEWSVAFLAYTPTVDRSFELSQPYAVAEGALMVPTRSAYQQLADLDTPGVRIAVKRGTAFDRFLSQNLGQAELVHAATSTEAQRLFLIEGGEALAGERQYLENEARLDRRFRVLSDPFVRVPQVIAVPLGYDAGAAYLKNFVERRVREGFVQAALWASS